MGLYAGRRGGRRRAALAIVALVVTSISVGAPAASAYTKTGCRLDPQIYDIDSSFYAPEINASVSAWNSSSDAAMTFDAAAGLKIFARNDGNTGYDGKSA